MLDLPFNFANLSGRKKGLTQASPKSDLLLLRLILSDVHAHPLPYQRGLCTSDKMTALARLLTAMSSLEWNISLH